MLAVRRPQVAILGSCHDYDVDDAHVAGSLAGMGRDALDVRTDARLAVGGPLLCGRGLLHLLAGRGQVDFVEA